MNRSPPPLVALLCGPGEGDVQSKMADEIRRLAHAEWLRTGNTNEVHNWHEAEKQLGGRLIHTGAIHWLSMELQSRDRQLAELSEKDHAGEDSTRIAERLREREALQGAAAREAQLRSEIAAKQAELASSEARAEELEPALEAQSAALAKRNRQLTDCESCVQLLKDTIEKQEAEVSRVKAAAEERCQDLESALEAKEEAAIASRDDQQRLQDSRIRDMEAWLGAQRENLERGLAELAEQSQARLERQRAPPPEPPSHGRPTEQALAATIRSLRSELANREQRLSAERRRVGQLEAIEEDLRKEIAASAASPEVMDMKPWEGHCPESALNTIVKCRQPSPILGPAELSLHREELLHRDKQVAHHKSQSKALESLLKARGAELNAREAQLQALQSQLAARDRRIREQERRSRQMDKQRDELTGLLEAQRTACTLQEEQAAELSEAQNEQIAGLKAQLEQCTEKMAQQLVTERALVSHTARLKEAEDRRDAQLQAQQVQLEAQDQNASRLLEEHSALMAELKAATTSRLAADEERNASDACAKKLGVSLEAQREELRAHSLRLEEQDRHAKRLEQEHSSLITELEVCRNNLAASEATLLTRDGELAALRTTNEEQFKELEDQMHTLREESCEAEKELNAQRQALLPLEARLQDRGRSAALLKELTGECEPKAEGGLASLEDKLALCLKKVRRATEAAAKERQSQRATRSTQATARSFLTVRGIDYGLLTAQPAVFANFKSVLQTVIALEAGPGVKADDVSLELWAGSVVVCATIVLLPPGLSAGAVEANLRSSSTLGEAVEERVAEIEGIGEVLTGNLSVIVQNVRPEARACGGSACSSPFRDCGHRGAGSMEALLPPPEPAPSSVGAPEPARGISSFFSALVPSKHRQTAEPIPEDGTVRQRVREFEAKVPFGTAISRDGAETPSSDGMSGGAEGAQGPSEARRSGRPCFRSRAYSGTGVSREGGVAEGEK